MCGLELVMDPVQLISCTLNSGTGHRIFHRCQHWHLDTVPQNIWDHVESYTMHISWPDSWNLMCSHKTKLIIFKQRVLSSVLPPPTEEAPLFVFKVRLQRLMRRTLWIQNPALVKQCILQRPFFSVPDHPIGCTCTIGTRESFFSGTKKVLHYVVF